MTRLLASLSISFATLGAVGVGAEAQKMIENQAVGLPAAAGIIVSIVGVCIYVERRFNARDIQQVNTLAKQNEKQAKRDEALEHRLTQIEDRLSGLKCLSGNRECPPLYAHFKPPTEKDDK